MNGYEKLVKELLLKHGYKLVRTGKGSHEIWASEKGVSVAVNHACKSRDTANSIMKSTGIAQTYRVKIKLSDEPKIRYSCFVNRCGVQTFLSELQTSPILRGRVTCFESSPSK